MAQVAVITVSDRASSGAYDDRSGPAAAMAFEARGHRVVRDLVPDEPARISQAVVDAMRAGAQVIVTTGGTGLSPRDVTPQTVAPMLSIEVPGIVDEIRRRSVVQVPNAMLSRGVAGLIDHQGRRVFVLTAPGSVGGVRDSVAVLLEVIDHLVDQLTGAGHEGSIPRPRPVTGSSA